MDFIFAEFLDECERFYTRRNFQDASLWGVAEQHIVRPFDQVTDLADRFSTQRFMQTIVRNLTLLAAIKHTQPEGSPAAGALADTLAGDVAVLASVWADGSD